MTRAKVRETVWRDQHNRCLFPTCLVWIPLGSMHAHEVVFRSRGGDPLDVAGVVGLCWRCHSHIHVRIGGTLKRIEGTKAEGLRFYERATGTAPWENVTPTAGGV